MIPALDWSTAPAWLLPNGSVMDAETITVWAPFAPDNGIEFDPKACQPLRTAEQWAERIDAGALDIEIGAFVGGECDLIAEAIIKHLKEIR